VLFSERSKGSVFENMYKLVNCFVPPMPMNIIKLSLEKLD